MHTVQLLGVCLAILSGQTTPFNVDTKKPIILEDPEGSSESFGYSVLLQSNKAFVGAPTAGVSVQCDLTANPSSTTASCKRIDKKNKSRPDDFFGASLANINQDVIVCAPKYMEKGSFRNLITKTGKCFKYNPTNENLDEFFHLTSAIQRGISFDWNTTSVMGMAMITESENYMQSNILIGVPYARTIGFHGDYPRTPGSIIRVYTGPGNVFTLPSTQRANWLTNLLSTKEDPHNIDLTGTSIATGCFCEPCPQTQYAIGSPNFNLFKGAVFICPDCFNGSPSFDGMTQQLSGQHFGAKFGQTLIALDLNNDNLDDLVVGAPLHSRSRKSYDTGKVYVYKNMGRLNFNLIAEIELNGLSDGARFGSSLANLGDIDNDNYKDFAVGAPYDGPDRQGAVFIFKGSENFNYTMHQIIRPETLSKPEMRGFGFSIYGKVDIDRNNYTDLIVGAVMSGHAVVLRSLEVIRVNLTVNCDNNGLIDPLSNNHLIEIIVTLQEAVNQDLVVKISFPEILQDSRIDLQAENYLLDIPSYQKGSSLRVRLTAVESNFGINVANLNLFPKPIEMKANLTWSLKQTSCPEKVGCPIFDPSFDLSRLLDIRVHFRFGCKNPSLCLCNFELLNERSTSEELIVTDNTIGKLNLPFRNTGEEPAFDTILRLTLNHKAKVEISHSVCKNVQSRQHRQVVECSLPGIQKDSNLMDHINILLRFEEFTSTSPSDIIVNSQIKSNCSESKLSQTFETTFNLKYDYNIKVKENVDFKQIPFKDDDIELEHYYTITNDGESPTDRPLELAIYLPKTDYFEKTTVIGSNLVDCSNPVITEERVLNQVEPPVREGFFPLTCKGSIKCMKIGGCLLSAGFRKGQSTDVVLKTTFVPKNVVDIFQLVVFSFLEFNDTKVWRGTELISTSYGIAELINQHPYVLVGIVIVIIIIVIASVVIYKTNCFTKMRFYKEKMDREEKLYRQSLRVQ